MSATWADRVCDAGKRMIEDIFGEEARAEREAFYASREAGEGS